MIRTTTFYVARHGETEWNTKRLLQGVMDSPLTVQGKKQAKNLAQTFSTIPLEALFSSDLLRAVHTAEYIAKKHKLIVTKTPMLRERNFGIFEGKPFDEYNTLLQEKLMTLGKTIEEVEPHFSLHPSMETNKQCLDRVFSFLRLLHSTHTGKTIAIITHGSVMRHVLIALGHGSHATLPPGSIGNAAYMTMQTDGTTFTVTQTHNITYENSRH